MCRRLFVLSIGSVFSWPTPVSPPGALPHLHPSSLLYFPVVPCQIGVWSAPRPALLSSGGSDTNSDTYKEGQDRRRLAPMPGPDTPSFPFANQATARAHTHPPRHHLPRVLSGCGAGWGSWLSSLLKFFFKHSCEWPAKDKLPGERPSKKML